MEVVHSIWAGSKMFSARTLNIWAFLNSQVFRLAQYAAERTVALSGPRSLMRCFAMLVRPE